MNIVYRHRNGHGASATRQQLNISEDIIFGMLLLPHVNYPYVQSSH